MDYQELGRAPATTLKGIPHAEKFSLGWWIVDLPHQYLKACNKHLPYMWVKFAIKNNHSQVCAPTPGIPLGKLGEERYIYLLFLLWLSLICNRLEQRRSQTNGDDAKYRQKNGFRSYKWPLLWSHWYLRNHYLIISSQDLIPSVFLVV